MTGPDWMAYLTAAKTALDIIKGIRGELPRGSEADKAQREIAKAESALETSKAELAKSLGFKLCKCSFPPPIMLWNATERSNICLACGDRNPPPPVAHQMPVHESDWLRARRGR
jgi:hypothetical protein